VSVSSYVLQTCLLVEIIKCIVLIVCEPHLEIIFLTSTEQTFETVSQLEVEPHAL